MSSRPTRFSSSDVIVAWKSSNVRSGIQLAATLSTQTNLLKISSWFQNFKKKKSKNFEKFRNSPILSSDSSFSQKVFHKNLKTSRLKTPATQKFESSPGKSRKNQVLFSHVILIFFRKKDKYENFYEFIYILVIWPNFTELLVITTNLLIWKFPRSE